MNIEIGKRYSVSPKWKKSWWESESLQHNDNGVIVEICMLWRGGTTHITPQNEDEVESLTIALSNEDGDEFYPHEYEDNEFDSTWDGISEDLIFHGELISEEEEDRLTTGYEEDGTTFLEEEGYYTFDNDVCLYGELDIIEEGRDEQYNL